LNIIQKGGALKYSLKTVSNILILEKNKPICTLQDNDSVIFFNFRSDRARQLTRAIKIPSFKEFEHENFKNLKFLSLLITVTDFA